jgi:cell division protein FtsA
MKSNYLVGIDVGTKKVCTIIGQIKNEEGHESLEIIGYGFTETTGIRKGVIVDMNATVEDIQRSVKEAELTAGVEVETAYVNISGSHIQSINAKGSININGRNREITQEDVERAVTHGSSIMLPAEKDILHVLSQEFILDGQEDIKDPRGMMGANLDVYLLIVTASRAAIKNLLICFKKARIEVAGVTLSHIASADAVLTPDDKELGVLLIDIGGGTTDFAVYEKGSLIYAATLPAGGHNFTNDLAIGTRTPVDRAERIKRQYGCGTDSSMASQTVEIPGVGSSKKRMIPISLLTEILRPRADEIFEVIKRQIEAEGYYNSINAGVVIVGGSAMLNGLVEIAEEIFSLPVRVGRPIGVGGLIDKVNEPEFATSVGLIKYGFEKMKNMGLINNQPKGWFHRIKELMGLNG